MSEANGARPAGPRSPRGELVCGAARSDETRNTSGGRVSPPSGASFTRREVLVLGASAAAVAAVWPLPLAAPASAGPDLSRPDPFRGDELPIQGFAGACSSSASARRAPPGPWRS
ncbi:hypothetical protein HY251_06685 [bacterium]|nr:hypothetical protein [bacterium]